MQALFERLDTKVQAQARYLARTLGIDPDETAQEMWMGILSKLEADPTLADQTDSYILKCGEFYARNEWRKGLKHARHVREAHGWGDATNDPTEYAPAPSSHNPEALAIERDTIARITSLPARIATLCLGLLAGYSKSEIAVYLGMSPANITNTLLPQARTALAEVLH